MNTNLAVLILAGFITYDLLFRHVMKTPIIAQLNRRKVAARHLIFNDPDLYFFSGIKPLVGKICVKKYVVNFSLCLYTIRVTYIFNNRNNKR